MRQQREHQTAGDHGCRRAGKRLAQGEEQERAGEQRAKESERGRTRPANKSKAQNRRRLKRDKQQNSVDESRIGDKVHQAFPVRRCLPGQKVLNGLLSSTIVQFRNPAKLTQAR